MAGMSEPTITTLNVSSGTPFHPGEFQHVLKELRDGKRQPDSYALFCIAEQVEANRKAIAELLEFEKKDQPENTAVDGAKTMTAEYVIDWICHNGGLINEWAKEWNPNHGTLTAYIRKRLEAALIDPQWTRAAPDTGRMMK
jgi:hypothetical protein